MSSLPNHFSAIGLGTSRLASLGSRLSKLQVIDLFGQALQMGVTVVDTADTYGSGDAERTVAAAIKKRRSNYFIITKAGFPYMSLPAFLSPLNQVGKKIFGTLGFKKNFSKKYLVSSLSKSLTRLGVSSVDLFLIHEPSQAELQNSPDFFEGLQYIKDSKMAMFVGISTDDVNAYQMAFDKNVVDFVQTAIPYNGGEDSVMKRAKAAKIPVIVNQVMRIMPTLVSDQAFMNALKEKGLQQKDLPTVIINYARKFKFADCVLTGTRNLNHLKQNVDSLKFDKDIDMLYQLIASKKI